MEKTDFLDAGDESGLGGIVKMELINIYQTRAFVELFYKVKDFRYMALYRVLCKKYKMENEFGKVNFLPNSVEINDFYVESRIVGYESISNYYKLKHYYFFLIITNEVIPIFVDKKSLTNEEMEKLELLVQQKMPQLKNQTAKTIKQRFAF